MPRSQRKAQLVTARERRRARKQRREDMLEDLAKGVHHAVIARNHNVSMRTVRREVGLALDAHWVETPQRHLRLQIARLNDALRLIDDALLDGRVEAIEPMLKVLDRLDRYNALGQPAEQPRLLALTHSGHESAPRAFPF